MSRTGLLTTWNSEHMVEMFNRKCTDIRPNHFKSALGGATYVYASWDSLPPSIDGAGRPTDRHRLDCDRHRLDCDRRAEWIIPCYLVGYHKFKPKSQYNRLPVLQISMFRSSSQDQVAASGQRRPAKPSGALCIMQSTTTCCTDCVMCPQAHVADSWTPQSFNVSPTRAVPQRRRFSFIHCLRWR